MLIRGSPKQMSSYPPKINNVNSNEKEIIAVNKDKHHQKKVLRQSMHASKSSWGRQGGFYDGMTPIDNSTHALQTPLELTGKKVTMEA